MLHHTYVPLSVREGGWRQKLGWWSKGRRQALAARLAPWMPNQASYEAVIRDGLDRARELREERDHWIRLFNRTEAAISHHKKATDSFAGTSSDDDDALYAARDRILKAAGDYPREEAGE